MESHGKSDNFLEILLFFPARENIYKTKTKYLSFIDGIATTETAPLTRVKLNYLVKSEKHANYEYNNHQWNTLGHIYMVPNFYR